jgi:cytochrome P450
VKHVLKDNFDNYIKGPQFNGTLSDFLGGLFLNLFRVGYLLIFGDRDLHSWVDLQIDGIFTTDGERWKTHRKVASNMFSKRLLEEGTEVALKQASQLKAKLGRAASSGEELDLQKAFFSFTMDTFCYIAFGVDLDSQNHDHEFTKAFDRVQLLCNARFKNPFWELGRYIGVQSEKEIRAGCEVMGKFGRDIIAAKRRDLAKGEKLGPDLISRFLQNAAKKGEQVTDQEVIDIVLNFIIAGRDTTACALSWSFYEMLKNPEVIDRVRAEVKEQVTDVYGKPIDELDHSVSTLAAKQTHFACVFLGVIGSLT